MKWLKKLLAGFRRTPRLVVEFRGDAADKSVDVRVSAVGTERAQERERLMMALFLLALERGAFALSHENMSGYRREGMDGLWQKACVLGWIILHEEELTR